MADAKKLRLVIDVENRVAKQAIDVVNTGLSKVEAQAVRLSRVGGSALESFQTKLAAMATRARQVVSGVTDSISAMATRARNAFNNAVSEQGAERFAANVRNFIQNPMQAAGGAVEGFLLRLGPMGVAAVAGTAVFTGLAVAAYKVAAGVADAAEQIDNISKRTGMTTTEVQELSLAAETMGVNFGAIEQAMRPLSQALSDNSTEGKKAKQVLKELGVVVEDDLGRFVGTGEFIRRFADRLRELPDVYERTNAAQKVLGKGSGELIPLLIGLSESLDTVRRSGAVMSEEAIKSALKVDEQFDKLWLWLRRFRNEASRPIVWTFEAAGDMWEWIKKNPLNDNRPMISGRGGVGSKVVAPEQKVEIGAKVNRLERRDIQRANAELEQYTKSLRGIENLEREYSLARQERERAFDALEGTRGKGDKKFRAAKADYEKALGAERQLKTQIDAVKHSQDGVRKSVEDRKHAEERAKQYRDQAMMAELDGLDLIRAKHKKLTDELRANGARPEAFRNADEGLAHEENRFHEEFGKNAWTGYDKIRREAQAAKRRQDAEELGAAAAVQNQLEALERERTESVSAYERKSIDDTRNARLAALDGLEAETLEQQIQVNQERLQIELEFAEQRTRAEKDRIDREARYRLEVLQATGGLSAKDYFAMKQKLDAISAEQTRQLDADLEKEKAALTQASRNRELNLIKDHHRAVFDDFKQGFEGIFDQIMSRTVSWGSLMKTVILTALKQVLSSQVAGMFTRLVTGSGGGGAQPAGRAGMLGGLGGLFGVPTFAGGIEGGTPPFIPSGGATGGTGAIGGGGSILGGFAAQGKGWLANLRGLGNIGRSDPSSALTTAEGGYRGIGGAKGGALLAGGSMLAMDGLRRGGFIGLAETTAGGAMIGAKFGGAPGAAIGAAIGAAAGIVRLFMKSAEKKVIDKVKKLYGGLTISKGLAQQIIAMGKEAGGVDAVLATGPVMDMLEAYAAATGQPFGVRNRVRAVSLSSSGGIITQNALLENGKALSFGGALGVTGNVASSLIPSKAPGQSTQSADLRLLSQGVNTGPSTVVLTLDPAQTMDVFEGRTVQVIADNPRTVAGSISSAYASNYMRRENTARQIAPGSLSS